MNNLYHPTLAYRADLKREVLYALAGAINFSCVCSPCAVQIFLVQFGKAHATV